MRQNNARGTSHVILLQKLAKFVVVGAGTFSTAPDPFDFFRGLERLSVHGRSVRLSSVFVCQSPRGIISNSNFCFTPSLPFQARLLSTTFKALSEKDLKKWQKKAEEDKLRYKEEMKDYVPMEEPGGRKKKAKKDPNAPKRNMSAYFLYSTATRSTVKEENPEASFGDIARLISANFKALSEKDRKKWDKKAEEDKERYQREMAAYNA